MNRKSVLVYLGLQFLTLNLCMVVGSVLFDVFWAYVNTIVLLFILPVAAGFLVGHYAGLVSGDEKTRESLCMANGLIGVLAVFAVGTFVYNGGRDTARSLLLREVECTPSAAAEEGWVDSFAFKDVAVLEEFSRAYTSSTTTSHRSHDGRSTKLSHTDSFRAAPLVSSGFKRGDGVAVWAATASSVARKRYGDVVAQRSQGSLNPQDDAPVVLCETIRDRHALIRYRKAAAMVTERFGLKEADRVHFVRLAPDFHAERRKSHTKGLIVLGIINALFVFLPAGIFARVLRKKDEAEA